MPRVRLTSGRVANRVYQNAGDELDVDNETARRLVAEGQAEPIGDAAPRQAMRSTPVRNAARRTK